MNAMRNKLGSRRGASITYALLIFLVCAVVSSVVIVAGTAAAGRMANLAQFDQRYYAVTSAAELLKELIQGKTLVVTKTTGPSAEEPAKTEDTYTVKYEGAASEVDPAIDVLDVLEDATLSLVNRARVQSRELALDTGIYQDALNCTVSEQLENGLLKYRITSGGSNAYVLEIWFKSNLREASRDNAAGVTQTTYTVKWDFHSMQKVYSQPVPTTGP